MARRYGQFSSKSVWHMPQWGVCPAPTPRLIFPRCARFWSSKFWSQLLSLAGTKLISVFPAHGGQGSRCPSASGPFLVSPPPRAALLILVPHPSPCLQVGRRKGCCPCGQYCLSSPRTANHLQVLPGWPPSRLTGVGFSPFEEGSDQ